MKPEGPYKTCSICGENRPITCFYRSAKTKDGLESRCKYCNSRAHYGSKKQLARAAEYLAKRYK